VDTAPWPRAEFERRLREQRTGYHIHHPFNVMLSSGNASREQIRGWVANRFYYQVNIPIKDAAILANCEERAVRRNWVLRILDHDGYGDDPGGIESWLRLAEAVGLQRTEVEKFQAGPAGRALRGRCVRQLRAPRALARGGVCLAHGAVRPRDPPPARRRVAAVLPVDRSGGA
jgi:pyrroloquinoline quinone (PQQ) biosynthesis protein C